MLKQEHDKKPLLLVEAGGKSSAPRVSDTLQSLLHNTADCRYGQPPLTVNIAPNFGPSDRSISFLYPPSGDFGIEVHPAVHANASQSSVRNEAVANHQTPEILRGMWSGLKWLISLANTQFVGQLIVLSTVTLVLGFYLCKIPLVALVLPCKCCEVCDYAWASSSECCTGANTTESAPTEICNGLRDLANNISITLIFSLTRARIGFGSFSESIQYEEYFKGKDELREKIAAFWYKSDACIEDFIDFQHQSVAVYDATNIELKHLRSAVSE